jgi:hypothetical protein
MRWGLSSVLITTTLGITTGCAPPPPPAQPPGKPPTPKSITLANPGGDAADPELAALQLLERGEWKRRRDRFGTLFTVLPDARHWRRVRIFGYPTRASFRYGDEHYAVVSVWYEPAKGGDDPESCLRAFMDRNKPIADAFNVHAAEVRRVRTLQQGETSSKPMVISIIDASVDSSVEQNEYAGALAAYVSFPGTCLLQGFIAVSSKHKELANRVRERWVAEGAPKLRWMTRVTSAPKFDAR